MNKKLSREMLLLHFCLDVTDFLKELTRTVSDKEVFKGNSAICLGSAFDTSASKLDRNFLTLDFSQSVSGSPSNFCLELCPRLNPTKLHTISG